MTFSPKTKARAMVASGRHCCICHKFRGLKIESHHIKPEAEGGDNSFENCIPVCFDCHADMRSYDAKHPRGTKYGESELRAHRDRWYEKVAASGGLTTTVEHRDTDHRTFLHILERISWDNIDFVKTNNFAEGSFPRDRLDPLFDYEQSARDPSKEFLDAALESMRMELVTAIAKFWEAIATYTFAHELPGRSTVPQEWAERDPEAFDKAVGAIHDSSKEVVRTYEVLVRAGRARLGQS